MKIPSFIIALLAVAHSARAEDCDAGEEKLEFTLYLDEDSLTENGWSLACQNMGTVWTMPIGSLQSTDPTADGYVRLDVDAPSVTEQVCISADVTCDFTLEDAYGDGLLYPGYFYLMYGGETIAVSEPEEEFFEKSYCLGPNCVQEPQDTTEACDDVYVYARADANPEQNSIAIACDDEMVFEHTFTAPQETIEFDECIPRAKCCTMTIMDSAKDGLDILEGASIYAEWANNVILRYDDISNAFEFDSVSYDFGLGCQEVDPNPTDVPAEAQETDVPTQPQEETEDNQPIVDALADTNNMMSKEPRGLSCAIIAVVVIGTLLLVGLLVFVALRCISRSQDDGSVAMTGKDGEVHSQCTDLDMEPL
jgi:hypothetical protein